MQLKDKIKKLIEDEYADFFGIADLFPAKDAIIEQGGLSVSEYPKSISIGITLPHTIVDTLPRRNERSVAVNYKNSYDVTNERLDIITGKLSSLLQNEGYKALPVPVHERADDERICAVFSHKLAANLAGLGWIGKSCMLITPEVGPRVRWATVLTDAPLEITGNPMEVQCGDCRECVEICPVSAFTGEPFRENEPRKVRYDAKKCEDYHNADENADPAVCGLCVYVCPHGRKK